MSRPVLPQPPLSGSQADLLYEVLLFLLWPTHFKFYQLLQHQTFFHRFFCPASLPSRFLLAFPRWFQFLAGLPFFRMSFVLRTASWGVLLQELSSLGCLLRCRFPATSFFWFNGEDRRYRHDHPLCDTCPWFLASHQISDRVFQAFGDERDPIHLQSFVRRDDETGSVLWKGLGSRMHEPVFQQYPGHFLEKQVLSSLRPVRLAC